MKRCPNCNIEYLDKTLEFCLEDGTPLLSVADHETESPTILRPTKTASTDEKTINLPFSDAAQPLESNRADRVETTRQKTLMTERVAEPSRNVLEIAPLVVALAHNWWQWIYLNNQYYSSFTAYILSANFLMWLLLLTTGAVIGLWALRRCQNKGFAFASLVILSINLILFLVPKR